MKANPLFLLGVLLCLAAVPLTSGCGEQPEKEARRAAEPEPPTSSTVPAPEEDRAAKVYADWPFDAEEAKRRQQETAEALGVSVEKTVDLGGGVKLELVLIPAGEFLMGSPGTEDKRGSDEGPQRRVRITKPFYMGKTEVTQEQWERVTGWGWVLSCFEGAKNPVEGVWWDDVAAHDEFGGEGFLRKLNARVNGKGTFALPTEAEWEYACRAGTATPFHTGETISTDQANYDGDDAYGSGREGVDREKTVPVGSFPPNAFGLHDMHGNVAEWCADWYGEDYYENTATDDPQGPAPISLDEGIGMSWWITVPMFVVGFAVFAGIGLVGFVRHVESRKWWGGWASVLLMGIAIIGGLAYWGGCCAVVEQEWTSFAELAGCFVAGALAIVLTWAIPFGGLAAGFFAGGEVWLKTGRAWLAVTVGITVGLLVVPLYPLCWKIPGIGWRMEAMSDRMMEEPEDAERRVLRGGSWVFSPRYCRSASRNWDDPLTTGSPGHDIGCRIVLRDFQ